ncbi:hypothetical protein AADG42_05545 [Ammonicoccus fulvus]|uniref:PH domain-containing protein n=1 Tax=Ammonicoccus fulvus TaxID=3138240 RepID=A0ABZ3FM92_9ACTN
MPAPHLVTVGRTVTTRGWSRLRAGVQWGVVALVVGLFMLWSVNIGHGIYALVALTVAAVGLTFFGGPTQLARTITMSTEGLHITRFHRIGTRVSWQELIGLEPRTDTDARGRVRSSLVLVPGDPEVFFHRHRELRAVRRGDWAVIPAGRGAETATELSAALAERP